MIRRGAADAEDTEAAGQRQVLFISTGSADLSTSRPPLRASRRQLFHRCLLPLLSSLSGLQSLLSFFLTSSRACPNGAHKLLLVVDPEVCKRGAGLEGGLVGLARGGRASGLLVAAGCKPVVKSRICGHATAIPCAYQRGSAGATSPRPRPRWLFVTRVAPLGAAFCFY